MPLQPKKNLSGRTFLGYKMSTDGGRHWSSFVNITRGFDSSSAFTSSKQLVLVYPLEHGVGLEGLMVLKSEPIKDNAPIVWQPPQPIALAKPFSQLNAVTTGPGGGGGIQLQTGPKRGRLLFCGVGHPRNDTRPKARLGYVVVSDDFGVSWRQTGAHEGLNECNLVEQADGSIYYDSRNQPGPTRCYPANFSSCRCKLGVVSHTQGDTFGAVFTVPSLPDPVCQGCMLRQQLGGHAHRYERRVASASSGQKFQRPLRGGVIYKKEG